MVDTLKEIPFALKFLIVIIITFGISVILTPIMTFVSKAIGAVDKPNERRVNKKPMPSAGGLVIFIAFAIATLFILPHIVHNQPPIHSQPPVHGASHQPIQLVSYFSYIWPFIVGAGIVVLTGLIDDIKEISPKMKLLGLTVAASFIWFFTNARFDNLKIPFGGPLLIFPAWLSFIFTVFWILAITNAINLIDGLDGLASGVSIISLTTMGIVSYFFLPSPNVFLPITIFIMVAAIMGFFPYNYHPAIIYLGDTGALFLGFIISVASLQGLKNATAVAVLTPLLILGVPITFLIIDLIFIIASITDKLDGSIARSKNLVTTFGKFLDPIADKILVLAALIMLVDFNKIPAWIPIIILFREFIVSGYRLIASQNGGKVIAASIWGKIKTVTQMVAIILIFIDKYNFFDFIRATTDVVKQTGSSFLILMTGPEMIFNIITSVLLLISVIATVISGIDYLKGGKELLKDK